MSGIVGFVRCDGAPAARDELDAALATLGRRGPDGARSWCEGPVALGCAQLRSTPQSLHETLPLSDAAAGLAIVHDARLDDRRELHRRLDLARPLAETGDGELLLAAWRRWGERCPEHLLGDFAFAIWDRGARTLFLARDQVGVRVIFWASGAAIVGFASEIGALAALPGVARGVDAERAADYLAGIAPDRGATFHAGIRRVLPGECVFVRDGRPDRRRYHEITLPPAIHRGSVEDVAAGFREVLTAAVRDRLDTARPVAAMLSGGLDSSMIVCAARAARTPGAAPLPTFSYVFSRTPVCDETPYIRAVVEQGGVLPRLFDADTSSPLAGVDELLASLGEPFDGAHLPYRRSIGALAAADGIGVLLEGSCGDAVTSDGLYFLAELARRGRLLRLAREVRGLARRMRVPPREALRRYALAPNVPAWLRRARRTALGHTARFQTPTLASRELAERTGLRDRFESFWHSQPPARDEREHHLREVLDHLPGSTFELTYAASAIEPRYPFLDRRVIEYCLAVPPSHRIQDGTTRMVARRAFAGLFPAAVAARTGKANPSASLLRRFYEADRDLVEDTLAQPGLASAGRWVDVPAVRAAYERGARWSQDHPSAQPPSSLWLEVDQVRKAVVLVRWLRSAGHEA